MKRLLSLAVCLALTVALTAGCGAKPAAENQGTDQTSETETDAGKEGKVKIGVLYSLLSAPAVKVFSQGIEQTAKELDVEIVALDGEWDATKQSDQMDTLISQGVDAVILNPIDASSLVPACKKAFDAGIPVVSGAMNVDESGQQYIVSYVGADEKDIGSQAAKMMMENVDKGQIAIIEGTAGASASIERTAGFEEALKESELEIITKLSGNFETASAMSATEDAITKNPELAGIFVHDDTMALGVVQAMKSMGYTGEDIAVISYNGSANGAKMLKDGDILATAVQPLFVEGKTSIEVCLKAIKGETVETWYKDQIDMLTQDNVDSYDANLLW